MELWILSPKKLVGLLLKIQHNCIKPVYKEYRTDKIIKTDF